MTVHALVFDLDGTLVDSRQDITTAVLAALEELGRPSLLDPNAIGNLVGRPLSEMFTTAAGELSPADQTRAAALYREHYANHCADHSRIYPGILPALDHLAGHTRLACATTKRPDQARLVLQTFGLLPRLAAWRGTSPQMRHKPAPDLIQAIARDLDVAPHSLIYVGDTPTDLQAAHAAGAQAAWVRWGYGHPDACLAEVPEHVLNTPVELLGLAALAR